MTMKVTIKSFKEATAKTESVVDSDSIYHEMYSKYVPPMGKADTVLGEIIRAVSRVCYRYYNDGDHFDEGYGVETAGSPAVYLMKHQPVKELGDAVAKGEGQYFDPDYEYAIRNIEQALINLLHDDAKVNELASQSNSTDSVMDFEDEAKNYYPDWDEDDDGVNW